MFLRPTSNGRSDLESFDEWLNDDDAITRRSPRGRVNLESRRWRGETKHSKVGWKIGNESVGVRASECFEPALDGAPVGAR